MGAKETGRRLRLLFVMSVLPALLAGCVSLESPMAGVTPAPTPDGSPYAPTRPPPEQPLVTQEQVLDYVLRYDARLAVWESPWSKATLTEEPDRIILRRYPSRLAQGGVSYAGPTVEPDAPVWHVAVKGNVRLSAFDADPHAVYQGVAYVVSERVGLIAVFGLPPGYVPATQSSPAPTRTAGEPVPAPRATPASLDQPLDTPERVLERLLVIDQGMAQWEQPWSVDTLKTEPGRITLESFPSRNAECGGCMPSDPASDTDAVWRIAIRGNVYLALLGIGLDGSEMYDGATYLVSQRTGNLLSVGSGRIVSVDAIAATRRVLARHGLAYDPYQARVARGVYGDFRVPDDAGAATPPDRAVYVVWFEANFFYDGVYTSDVYVYFDVATGQALQVVARPAPIEALNAKPWEAVYRYDASRFRLPYVREESPAVSPGSTPAKP